MRGGDHGDNDDDEDEEYLPCQIINRSLRCRWCSRHEAGKAEPTLFSGLQASYFSPYTSKCLTLTFGPRCSNESTIALLLTTADPRVWVKQMHLICVQQFRVELWTRITATAAHTLCGSINASITISQPNKASRNLQTMHRSLIIAHAKQSSLSYTSESISVEDNLLIEKRHLIELSQNACSLCK